MFYKFILIFKDLDFENMSFLQVKDILSNKQKNHFLMAIEYTIILVKTYLKKKRQSSVKSAFANVRFHLSRIFLRAYI
jgi:hypothetical protein